MNPGAVAFVMALVAAGATACCLAVAAAVWRFCARSRKDDALETTRIGKPVDG